jgi:chaperonin cofactor prefoldin
VEPKIHELRHTIQELESRLGALVSGVGTCLCWEWAHKFQELGPKFQKFEKTFQDLEPEFQELELDFQELKAYRREWEHNFQDSEPKFQQSDHKFQEWELAFQALVHTFQEVEPTLQEVVQTMQELLSTGCLGVVAEQANHSIQYCIGFSCHRRRRAHGTTSCSQGSSRWVAWHPQSCRCSLQSTCCLFGRTWLDLKVLQLRPLLL